MTAGSLALIAGYVFSTRFFDAALMTLGISFAPDWGEWQVLSLFDGADVALQPGMCFHLPIALREYGAFTVGNSESVVITETGCHVLSGLPGGIRVL